VSQTLFLIISALGLLAALGTVLNRNLVHAALHLVGFFFVVACQFVLLEAEFLAAIQVLIYIGAGGDPADVRDHADPEHPGGRHDDALPLLELARGWWPGWPCSWCSAAGSRAGSGPRGIPHGRPLRNGRRSSTTRGVATGRHAVAINNMGKAVGDEMLTRFVIPFEVAGLLLTAALVGAIALAFREGDESLLIRLRAEATGSTGTSAALGSIAGATTGNGHGQETRNGTRDESLTHPMH